MILVLNKSLCLNFVSILVTFKIMIYSDRFQSKFSRCLFLVPHNIEDMIRTNLFFKFASVYINF